MKLIDRIENANSIANGLKPNEIIDAKVIYDLQLHLSEAIELVKDLTIPIVSFSEERADVLNGCTYRIQDTCKFIGNCKNDACDLRKPFKI